MLIAIYFIIPNKSNAETKEEYRYIQNIDYAPRFVINATNKNYLLITFKDNTEINTNSIKVYKYNKSTKKYDKEIKTEVLKEDQENVSNKSTIIKILRKNISNKSENVKIKIIAKDNDKNQNNIYGYLIVKPLTEKKIKNGFNILMHQE